MGMTCNRQNGQCAVMIWWALRCGPACGGRASQGRARRWRRASGAAGAALDL